MAQRIEGTAFARIEKFEDNKSEQVWELFSEEFMRAVVSADGETAWKLVNGDMRIEDISKELSSEEASKLIADIAMSTSANVTISSSWISTKNSTAGKLTDLGVLMARSAMYSCLATYREFLLNTLLAKGTQAKKIMLEITTRNCRLAVPEFFDKMQTAHGRKARELVAAYTAMIMRQQIIPVSEQSDVLKDLIKPKQKGEDQFPSFSVFNPQIHSTTLFFTELDRLREKLARVQKSSGGPMGSGVQDQDVGEAMITALETESKYDMVLFEYRQTIKSRVQVQITESVGTRGQDHDRSEAEEAASQAQVNFDLPASQTSSSSVQSAKTVDLSRVGGGNGGVCQGIAEKSEDHVREECERVHRHRHRLRR